MARHRKRSHRKRAHRKHRKAARAVVVYAKNPRHRRHRKSYARNEPARRHRRHRRSYRSNPAPRLIPTAGFLIDIAQVAGGFYASKISAGFVLPMIGISGNLPRLAVKSVLAWGIATVGGMALGSKVQQNLLIGGAVEVMQDAIRTYVSPFVPALAAADTMEAYYQLATHGASGTDSESASRMGAYYSVGAELPGDNVAL